MERLENISLIKEEMFTDPKVNVRAVLHASRLAEEDNYLYDLMIDWMKVTDDSIKSMLMEEIVNYTDEVLRKMKIRNEL